MVYIFFRYLGKTPRPHFLAVGVPPFDRRLVPFLNLHGNNLCCGESPNLSRVTPVGAEHGNIIFRDNSKQASLRRGCPKPFFEQVVGRAFFRWSVPNYHPALSGYPCCLWREPIAPGGTGKQKIIFGGGCVGSWQAPGPLNRRAAIFSSTGEKSRKTWWRRRELNPRP